jgi:hypothetical protein
LTGIKARTDTVEMLRKDAWVWGESAAGLANAGALFSKVTSLYEADYIPRGTGCWTI